MNPLYDVLRSTIMIPLLATQGALNQIVQLQREQTLALADFLATVAGREVMIGGMVTHEPQQTDLFIGKSLSQTKTLTDLHTLFFGFLSLDFNPLHFNEEFARRTRFRGRILHGMHTASLFSGVLAKLTPGCVYLRQEIDFLAPVRPGETLIATGTIEEIDPKGTIQVSLACRNQNREVVARGMAVVKKLKEVYSPAPAAA